MNNEELITEAKGMLDELRTNCLRVVLIPAPYPQFIGHKIRSAETQNPDWYRKMFYDLGHIDRKRVIRTLEKIIKNKSAKNVYVEYIKHIAKQRIESYLYESPIFENAICQPTEMF